MRVNLYNSRDWGRILIFLLTLIGVAPSLSASQTIKIGYVDFQKALNDSDAGKEAREEFSKEVEKRQKEVNRRQEELKNLGDEIEKMKRSGILKESVIKEREKELQLKTQELQEYVLSSENDLRRKESELTRNIANELRVIVEEYAKEKGLTYVFEKIEGGIIYAPSGDDITEEIVKRYNKRYKEGKKK